MLYESAASDGHILAQHFIARWKYDAEYGYQTDIKGALKIFQNIADNHQYHPISGEAASFAGRIYNRNVVGTAQMPARALEHHKLAVELGDFYGHFRIAGIYHYNEQLRDLALALEHYEASIDTTDFQQYDASVAAATILLEPMY